MSWVEVDTVEADSPFRCRHCGGQQRPRDWNLLLRERYGSTVSFAAANGIDLPSANSVLLGLMSLEQAQEIPNEILIPQGTHPALRKKPKHREGPLACIALLLATAAFAMHGHREWQRQISEGRRSETLATAAPITSPVSQTLSPMVRIESDEFGRTTAIRAPNPGSVLLRFCRDDRVMNACEPLELAELRPANPGARLGLFREFGAGDLGGIQAIVIRKDPDTRLWVAGGEGKPVTSFIPSPNRIGRRVADADVFRSLR